MVPLVLLVHPDPPWSTFSVKFQKVWIRMDRIGPGSDIFLMHDFLGVNRVAVPTLSFNFALCASASFNSASVSFPLRMATSLLRLSTLLSKSKKPKLNGQKMR